MSGIKRCIIFVAIPVVLLFGAFTSAQAIDEASQTTIANETSTSQGDCLVSQEVRNLINAAKEAKYHSWKTLSLIRQAEAAVRHPLCDNIKTKILASEAMQLSKILTQEAIARKKAAERKENKIVRTRNWDKGTVAFGILFSNYLYPIIFFVSLIDLLIMIFLVFKFLIPNKSNSTV